MDSLLRTNDAMSSKTSTPSRMELKCGLPMTVLREKLRQEGAGNLFSQ